MKSIETINKENAASRDHDEITELQEKHAPHEKAFFKELSDAMFNYPSYRITHENTLSESLRPYDYVLSGVGYRLTIDFESGEEYYDYWTSHVDQLRPRWGRGYSLGARKFPTNPKFDVFVKVNANCNSGFALRNGIIVWSEHFPPVYRANRYAHKTPDNYFCEIPFAKADYLKVKYPRLITEFNNGDIDHLIRFLLPE